jgi:hypothetical protein
MNDLLYILKTCKTDEEIKEVVDYYIEECTKVSPGVIHGKTVIGKKIGINPEHKFNDFSKSETRITNRWAGYIPKGTKVNYKCISHEGKDCNDGGYYYMGDESYLYEFAKFVQGMEFYDNVVYFIKAVDRFIHGYFDNRFLKIDREELHKLLEGVDGRKLGPVKEHLLSDFRGKGAAVCTEYSAMAQNIMTIFGLKTEMLMGRRHAYNMLFENGEVSVVDFTDHVKIYDIKYNLLEEIPFVVSIGEYDPVKYYEFIYGNRQLVIGNYDVVRFSSFDCVVEDELDRIYNADGGLVLKKK